MRGASKALCIITGIIDIFLTLGTLIFIIVALAGGLSALLANYGGGSDGGPQVHPSMMIIMVVLLCGAGFIVSLIATICAFNAAAGKKGACIATIVFGFMGQNIFAIIGGILGAIAAGRRD